MRSGTFLLTALFLACTVSIASCGCGCSGGGGGVGSYNFLGDMAFNGMLSQFEDMMREATSVQTYDPYRSLGDSSPSDEPVGDHSQGVEANTPAVSRDGPQPGKGGNWFVNLGGQVTGEIVTGEIVTGEIVTGEIVTGEIVTGEIVTGEIYLFEVNDRAFGSGVLKANEEMLLVTASGSSGAESLNLDLVAENGARLYRMSLNREGEAYNGSYEAFSTGGRTWAGPATVSPA